jgi:hypothetical protein
MRRADPPQRFRIRRIVEQHAAAAVDLAIDETRQQDRALQVVRIVRALQCLVLGHDLDDASRFHQHRDALFDPAIGEDTAIDQGKTVTHTVSVTLFRCGGTSGLCPRRNANALMAR